MSKRVVLIRHGDDPPDDRVYSYLVENGFTPQLYRPYLGDVLGKPDDSLAGTVIYGGRYNASDSDKHLFLKEEYRWIEACLHADVPMLGICQGAQMIATQLGASAGPLPGEPHEFGYYPIYPTSCAADFLTRSLVVPQAHYHMFDIPEGAVRLAQGDTFDNQAFRFGDKVYALQFHAEATIEVFRRWQNGPWAHLYSRPGAQSTKDQTMLMMQHDLSVARWFYSFLDKLFGQL